METQRGNLFDLLRDDDHKDPSQLIAAAKQPQKIPSVKGSQPKLPSKPLPPQQAVKEARNNGAQRIQTSQSQFLRSGTHGQNREFRAKGHDVTHKQKGVGEVRPHEALLGTQMEIFTEKGSKENAEKLEKMENRPVDDGNTDKDDPQKEEEKEPEDKEMTLEEYEKLMEERRKALVSMKTEERS
ncbi:hypothetical protein FCM35_KLT01086 [Carex littledalei]|uniref:Uncharacterized protein n=1 Tax=Carex littledalei TaxID=544730 RepID=A0A833QTB2_9POAL|nr:hypothetical protein FCM35_KLT01086 [Carex littledalei]